MQEQDPRDRPRRGGSGRMGRGRAYGGGRNDGYPLEGQGQGQPQPHFGYYAHVYPQQEGPQPQFLPHQGMQPVPMPSGYYPAHPGFGMQPGHFAGVPPEVMMAYASHRPESAQAQQQIMMAPYGPFVPAHFPQQGYAHVPLTQLPAAGGSPRPAAPPQAFPGMPQPQGYPLQPPFGHGWPAGMPPPPPQPGLMFPHMLRQPDRRTASARGSPSARGRSPAGGRGPRPAGPPSSNGVPRSSPSGSQLSSPGGAAAAAAAAGAFAGLSVADGGPGALRGSRSSGSLGGNGGGAPASPRPPPGGGKADRRLLFDGDTWRPLFALDIECVATGPRCQDRAAAQIGVVDGEGNQVLNVYVRPEQPVVSYITELTGLTAEKLQREGVPFAKARQLFRAAVPRSALLVGFSISSDLSWLRLTDPSLDSPEKATDRDVRDLSGLFRLDPDTGKLLWKPTSQDHLVRCLLGGEGADGRHDAVGDARKSMRLWHRYHELKASGELRAALEKAEATPRQPPFNQKHPTYEGVCMGNRSHCQCSYPDKPWLQRRPPARANGSADGRPEAAAGKLAQEGANGSAPAAQAAAGEAATANGDAGPRPAS